ncbi:AT-hook motif nuclear-localized protein 7 [Vigna radiata var. radiata]|uniref:AT-hook motif nuclear-localized protein n=1 Tax=Vigna radiata var. radiata TaxID=3916 RepID=A0A1S3VYP8_VIGRR|nr:AT-hook motif nuclear-localized protein 7 [Vigna radiata var. radiata]XP_022632353.1 AT-hook motif nuclear-localized protein 7 [Vigna radiata var. radiata]XP_022632354.1 AT-hook motif nuclear-localized protein 7 [Vigna radiata var. radiata]XP_022632355.1 AT-hook motif nuclear-localized protein 7 [Vigna radiata var. radiata]
MEGREGMSSGVTVIGAEAPSVYHMAPRSEAPSQGGPPVPEAPAAAIGVSPVSVALDGTSVKKKRGRPRKYGPDGLVNMALSPMPISSSAPFSNNFSSGKRGKPRGMDYKLPKKVGVDYLGGSDGTSFMPHIITVNSGEDIAMKVISFSQQGPRAICILSASGVISNVTLRQPDSSGGTLTYEGRFEILSLSGSFMPTENQGTRSRSGGMSVSLSSPDGRVVGGGVAGLLVAAGPVQVVVGSFLPCSQQDQKPKKPKSDYAPATVTPSIAVSSGPPPSTNGGEKEVVMGGHILHNSGATLNSNLSPPSAFRRENWVNMHSMTDSMKSATDINISLPDS